MSLALLQTYDLSLVGEVESQHNTIVESLHVYTSVRGIDNTFAVVKRILLNSCAPLSSFLGVVEPHLEEEVETVMLE